MLKLTGNGLIFLQPVSVTNYFFAFSIQKLVVLCFQTFNRKFTRFILLLILQH